MKKNLFTKKGIVLMLFVTYFSSNINLFDNLSTKSNIDGNSASTASDKAAKRP